MCFKCLQMHALSVDLSVKPARLFPLFSSMIRPGLAGYPHWNSNNRICVQDYLRLASPSKSSYVEPFVDSIPLNSLSIYSTISVIACPF